jgi:hypothetical protein
MYCTVLFFLQCNALLAKVLCTWLHVHVQETEFEILLISNESNTVCHMQYDNINKSDLI